ncbi:unnamed protein product [Urochloa humidicola]
MGKRRRHRRGGVAGGEGKRRRRSESPSGGDHEKKQLYMALDDWEKGYNIHKVIIGGGALTDPPAVRLEAPRGMHDVVFGAIGSKILALWQPRNCCQGRTRAAVYDAATGAVLAEGPAHPPGLQPMRFVATGGNRQRTSFTRQRARRRPNGGAGPPAAAARRRCGCRS